MGLIPRLGGNTHPDAVRAVDLVKSAVDPILRQGFLNGVVLGPVSVTAGQTTVLAHNLGRAIAGAQVVLQATGTALIQVFQNVAYTPTPDPTRAIALFSTGTGTIYVRVF